MINRMIGANLVRRPVRSLVSLLAVAIEVALILLIVGLTEGMVSDTQNRVRGVNADIVVRPSNGSMYMSMAGNTLPLKLADRLLQEPGVKAVAPVAMQMNNKSLDSVGGLDLAAFTAVSGPFQYLKGGGFTGPMDVIVDDLYAAAKHVRVGQSLTLLGHPFQVTGIFEHGKGGRIYVPLATLDGLIGAPDKAAVMYVKLNRPQDTDTTVAALQQLLPDYNIQPIQEYLALFTSANMPGLPVFQRTMVGIAVTIGFLVIFLSMYTTILERTREIGILKALGASRSFIARVILRESSALAVGGIVGGVLLAVGVQHGLRHVYPTLPITLTWIWMVRAAGIALIGSLVGALYPAAKAAAQDPIAALAYE